MATYLQARRYYERHRTRASRLQQAGIRLAFSAGGPVTPFEDYFPDVEGTKPEKLLFNWLAKKHINFYFSVYFGDIPFTQDRTERYRPDFLLPDYRIIIDVQGVYWHTRPGSYNRDYLRTAMLEAAGYKVLQLTDTEILEDLDAAIYEHAPELINPAITGDNRFVTEQGFNPLAPLLARIKARPKIVRTRYLKERVRTLFEWQAGKPIKKEKFVEPLFRTEDIDPAYLKTVKQFGLDWKQYVEELGAYFQQFPEAAPYYPDLYNYWLRWRGWWGRLK